MKKILTPTIFGSMLALISSIASAQSEADTPCALNPGSENCLECIDEVGGAEELVALICYGGPIPDAASIPLNSISSVCSMDICSADLEVYQQCLDVADNYLRSGTYERLSRRKDELSSFDLSISQVCQPDALPALASDAAEALERFSVFDKETNLRWDGCFSQIQEDLSDVANQGILEDSSVGYGTREVMNAWQILDQIPSIQGKIFIRGTFSIGENLRNLTDSIDQDYRICTN